VQGKSKDMPYHRCSINKTDSLIQVGSVKEGLSNSMLSGILNSDLHLGVLLLTLCNAAEDNKEVPKSNLLSWIFFFFLMMSQVGIKTG
jgi:hypothetical protein